MEHTVTTIVSLASIVGEETQSIVFRCEAWVFFQKLLNSFPEGGNRGLVFV